MIRLIKISLLLSACMLIICGCGKSAHRSSSGNALDVKQTSVTKNSQNGIGKFEYSLSGNKSGRAYLSIEIFEYGKLVRVEHIDKLIDLKTNDYDKFVMAVLGNRGTDFAESSDINWRLWIGQNDIEFRTNNFINKCVCSDFHVVSEAFIDSGNSSYILAFIGDVIEKNTPAREGTIIYNSDNRTTQLQKPEQFGDPKLVEEHDYVYFLKIRYDQNEFS